MKPSSSLAIILLLLLASHQAIVLVLGQPLGVDTWPLINMADKTLGNPNLKLMSDELWDRHNNRWPGITSLSIQLTLATGTTVNAVYSYLLPFMLELLATLALYATFKRLVGRHAWIGVGVTLFSPPIFMFLQEPVKEILSAAIIITLIIPLVATHDKRSLATIAVLALGAVVSHPLPPLILMLIMATLLALTSMLHQMNPGQPKPPAKIIPPLLILAAIYAAYNTFSGLQNTEYAGLIRDFTLAYMLYLYFTSTIYIYYNINVRRLAGAISLLTPALVAAALILGTRIVPRTSQAQLGYTIYTISFLISLTPLIQMATALEKDRNYHIVKHVSGAALVVLGSATLYIATYATIMLSVIHRVIHYFIPFIGLITAYTAKHGKLLPLTVLTALVVASTALALLFTLDYDPTRYTWRYTTPETAGINQITKHTTMQILGDEKTIYYLKYKVLVKQPLDTLGKKIQGKGIMIIYKDMLKYGYWANPTTIISPGTVKQATQGKPVIYNNQYVEAVILG